VRASGHPEAEHVASSVEAFAASGAPLTIGQGVQLKVAGGARYSDPSYELEETEDEEDARLRDALPRAGRRSRTCTTSVPTGFTRSAGRR
jgi:hypothetical protein